MRVSGCIRGTRGCLIKFAEAISCRRPEIKTISCPKNRTPLLQECAFIHPSLSPLLIAGQEEETEAHFEPVIKLTEQVETKTLEENEEVLFKMCDLFFLSSAITRKSSLGVLSSSVSRPHLQSGRKEERAMFVCSSTRKPRKFVL